MVCIKFVLNFLDPKAMGFLPVPVPCCKTAPNATSDAFVGRIIGDHN